LNTIAIRNGRVIDPSQKIDAVTDVFVRDGKVVAVGPCADPCDTVIDAQGLIVCPGLIDMHVHLREPGGEESETIATGARAAVAGGVTSVACMPNTDPAIDSRDVAEFVSLQAKRAGWANVFPIGAVTKGRKGEELAELGQLVEGGAVAFTDDGSPIESAEIMRRALQYSKMFDKPILTHSEVRELTKGGVMNEGFVSMKLGLPGMPAVAEEIMIARDIMLAEVTGGRLHVLHVSTAGSVDLIRQGKSRGVKVTTEACPHHFLLTDECMTKFDSNYKMSPPLRTEADVREIIGGLVDGTIDAICTDHAPHALAKKALELDQAPFGIVGLETLIPLCVHGLIEPGYLDWPDVIEKLTASPARILGIAKGTLTPGADADITIIDPNAEWVIDPTQFLSKSRNSPFSGWSVTGRAHTVILGGVVKALTRNEGASRPNATARMEPAAAKV
jgi:dihydroorotase